MQSSICGIYFSYDLTRPTDTAPQLSENYNLPVFH